MAFSTGDPSRPQINVTPFIDVLLVLIIIFIFLVVMSRPQGLEARIPQPAKDSSPEKESSIVIQIYSNTARSTPLLKINNEDIAWNDLQARLQKIYTSRVERVAFVRGDDDVDFQYVADVIDIAKSAGVYQVALMPRNQN
ncbi:MAG TPA: biopolymer transporter ExbD [Terriglobales bacterium]|jgi:biopolymer transport protein ExbD